MLVFIFLLAGASVVAAVVLRWIAVKVTAGFLALVLAAFGGVVGVNDYFGYYQSWGAAYSDLTGQTFAVHASEGRYSQAALHVDGVPRGSVHLVTLTGAKTHISRTGYIYLPPQYSDPAYRTVRFPVLELLPGMPGSPADWFDVMHINDVMDQLIATHRVGPMILVAARTHVGNVAEECLNSSLAQDDTYVNSDIPAYVRAHFRASDQPAQWALFGTSAGGYCATNLALRHPADWGAAVSLDGYYLPSDGPAQAIIDRNPRLAHGNNPIQIAAGLPPGTAPLPAFWLSVGTANKDDVREEQLLVAAMAHLEQVHVMLLIGGTHTGYTFRETTPPALEWCWDQLSTPLLKVDFPLAGRVIVTNQKRRPPVRPELEPESGQ